jgi:hypothetical protein
MRELKYFSPSSYLMYRDDVDRFVEQYLIDLPRSNDPPSIQMSIGSAFDAFVKSNLAKKFYEGEAYAPYQLETIFNKQVSEEHREEAWKIGKFLYEQYVDQGGFHALLSDMEGNLGPIYFEREAQASVRMPSGRYVPFKGFPDCSYINKHNKLVILDWKCNGYCSSKRTSPKKHYVISRPDNTSHKKITPTVKYDLTVVEDHCFSEVDMKWAIQLTIYSWLLGRPIGDDTVFQIEQLLMEPGPAVRCITYRGFTTPEFQIELANEIDAAWHSLKDGYIYRHLTRQESDAKMATANRRAAMALSNNPILDIIRGARK